MNNYDITILYAYRDKDAAPEFPHQTISKDHLQLVPIREDDVFHPRKNSLAAVARAEGRFTIMLDEGDEFDASFLERMLQAADKSHTSFAMPALSWPIRRLKATDYFQLDKPADICIDLSKSQRIFPIDLHALLIPTRRLQAASKDLRFPAEPEKQILLRLLGEESSFAYLGTCLLRYAFPKECTFQYDMRPHTRDWYYDSFQQFLLPLFKEQRQPGKLLQYLALYMINIRIDANQNNRNKHVLAPEEVSAYYEILSQVLQYVDYDTLVQCRTQSSTAFTMPQEILFYLRLKKRDYTYYPELRCGKTTVELICDGQVLGDTTAFPVHLVRQEYSNGCLELDGSYLDFISDDTAQVCAQFDHKNYPLTYNHRYSLNKYFGVSASRMKTFHVSIPVTPSDKNRLLRFVLCASGKEYVLEYVFPNNGSRFAKDFGYAYWRFGDYLSYWQKDGIHVIRSTKLTVLKKEVALWLQMWKKKDGFYRGQLPVKILNFLLRPYYSRQKIWLFMDKIYKGADSSEYIYRYAAKQKDGIKKYYLLDKSSADYARMVKEGYKPLVRGSLKHRLVFLNADMVIASNSTVFAFNDYTFERSLPIRGDVHFDVACVQHGMSVQKIAVAQQRLRDNTRLYFCASKYEIENLSKPEYDYVGYDALKLTGVPRYDGLVNRAQKIIVISPTWRMQSALPPQKSESFARDYNPNFKETEYYRVYNGLINDPRLLEAARKYGYRIQYVLHPIVSPQHDDFTKNDVVEIIPSIGDMSYEKIFCEGALMVTDFSGVQFDFAYMRKPVIYLHHEDIPQHYEEGTFHYKTMGFGEICHTNDELIDVLCKYMKNDCVMPELYRQRADDFFEFSDNHNCERIYPIMLEHERNRK